MYICNSITHKPHKMEDSNTHFERHGWFKPLMPSIIYIASQLVAGLVLTIFIIATANALNKWTLMAWMLLCSDILAVLILQLTKSINFRKAFSPSSKVTHATFYALAGAATGIFATDILTEFLSLPNSMEEDFMRIQDSSIGILSIAVIGPIAEELAFRQATLGGMLHRGMRPARAIIISALLFGIIHLNWAQTVPAFVIGVILGIIYFKTRNIILTSIIHIANNSIAVAMMATLGEDASDFSLVGALGGNIAAIALIAVCYAISAFLLLRLWRSPSKLDHAHLA